MENLGGRLRRGRSLGSAFFSAGRAGVLAIHIGDRWEGQFPVDKGPGISFLTIRDTKRPCSIGIDNLRRRQREAYVFEVVGCAAGLIVKVKRSSLWRAQFHRKISDGGMIDLEP